MKSTDQKQLELGVLMGQIEGLLDYQFFGFAMEGDMAANPSAVAQTALALHAAWRGGLSSAQLQDAMVCRDALLRAIRSGLSLCAALRQARTQEPSRSAFDRLQGARLGRVPDSAAGRQA